LNLRGIDILASSRFRAADVRQRRTDRPQTLQSVDAGMIESADEINRLFRRHSRPDHPDAPENDAELRGNRLGLLVVGVLLEVVVHISQQVEQALLLRTVDAVIRIVKVRNQHPEKPASNSFKNSPERVSL
jgi:hypothetical protein